MKTLARTLIFLIILYSLALPVWIFYAEARKTFFPPAYREMIRDAARTHRLDPLLVAALVYTESSFRPHAVSKSGAMGLMQIMPETALDLARQRAMRDFRMKQLFDPRVNLDLGCFYLRKLEREFHDVRHVLVAFNAGRSNLKRWLGRGDLLSRSFPETRKYVIKIRTIYQILQWLHRIRSFY